MRKNNLQERIASIQHEIWSHWMKYLFEVSVLNKNGSVTIPPDFCKRWKRQMELSYHLLSDKEQESDRDQADKVLEKLSASDFR